MLRSGAESGCISNVAGALEGSDRALADEAEESASAWIVTLTLAVEDPTGGWCQVSRHLTGSRSLRASRLRDSRAQDDLATSRPMGPNLRINARHPSVSTDTRLVVPNPVRLSLTLESLGSARAW